MAFKKSEVKVSPTGGDLEGAKEITEPFIVEINFL